MNLSGEFPFVKEGLMYFLLCTVQLWGEAPYQFTPSQFGLNDGKPAAPFGTVNVNPG